MSSIVFDYYDYKSYNFKNMQDTKLMEFQCLSPKTLPKYYKMMRFDEFL